MMFTPPTELNQIKTLIDGGQHEAALKLIESIEKKDKITKISCQLLECEILFQQGLYKQGFELAEKTYNESKGLTTYFLIVDALLLMINFLFYQGILDKPYELIKQAEELIKKTKNEVLGLDYKEREAQLFFLKAKHYAYASTYDKKDHETAIENLKKSLFLWEQLDNKRESIFSLLEYGIYLGLGEGKLDSAIKCTEKALKLAEESHNIFFIAYSSRNLMILHSIKGEFDQSLIHGKKSLNLFEKLKNNPETSRSLCQIAEQYRKNGDYVLSLKYLNKALALHEELDLPIHKVTIIANMVEVSIALGDIELARGYVKRLQEIDEKIKIPWSNLTYRAKKAQLLGTSPRAKNRLQAEEIYKKIIKEHHDDFSINEIYLELCDLLLFELQVTNDMELVEEIESYITYLFKIAEKSNSFWLMGETYLLMAKLSLLRLDLNKARQLLIQGQQIAEEYDLKLLAIKISNEHDKFNEQVNLWENLKRSKAPLKTRFELTGLREQMNSMLYKSKFIPAKMEAEKPILLIIISRNGTPILFNHFTADMVVNDTCLGEFLLSYNTYCNQIFSETFDRVKLGQYTVLINAVNSFSICYLFQGQTYSAQQKVKHFSEALSKNNHIKGILNDANSKTKIIEVNEYPIFEELITKSFMADPQHFQTPFKAYLGDGRFVFASYAHTDKLEVYPIIDYLNKMGVNIWYDEGIPVSENWKKSIAVNLDKSTSFLVFISPNIINSEMVRKEISFALKKKKPFFAVYLKETKLPTELEFEIADIQAIMKHLTPKNEFYIKLNELLYNSLKD